VLIPELLQYGSVPDACRAARGLVSSDFAPLQLVAVPDALVRISTWDGLSSTTEYVTITQPLLFTGEPTFQ
jgi:hypothetical protein